MKRLIDFLPHFLEFEILVEVIVVVELVVVVVVVVGENLD